MLPLSEFYASQLFKGWNRLISLDFHISERMSNIIYILFLLFRSGDNLPEIWSIKAFRSVEIRGGKRFTVNLIKLEYKCWHAKDIYDIIILIIDMYPLAICFTSMSDWQCQCAAIFQPTTKQQRPYIIQYSNWKSLFLNFFLIKKRFADKC